jgi:hypothetical protein
MKLKKSEKHLKKDSEHNALRKMLEEKPPLNLPKMQLRLVKKDKLYSTVGTSLVAVSWEISF